MQQAIFDFFYWYSNDITYHTLTYWTKKCMQTRQLKVHNSENWNFIPWKWREWMNECIHLGRSSGDRKKSIQSFKNVLLKTQTRSLAKKNNTKWSNLQNNWLLGPKSNRKAIENIYTIICFTITTTASNFLILDKTSNF